MADDFFSHSLGVGWLPLEHACLLVHEYNLSSPEVSYLLDCFRRIQTENESERLNFLDPWIYPKVHELGVDPNYVTRTEKFRQLLWASLSMVGSESLVISELGVDSFRLVRVIPKYETLGIDLVVCHLHSTEIKRVSFPSNGHGMLSQIWLDIMDVRTFERYLSV